MGLFGPNICWYVCGITHYRRGSRLDNGRRHSDCHRQRRRESSRVCLGCLHFSDTCFFGSKIRLGFYGVGKLKPVPTDHVFSARLKIERAKKHLEELQREVTAFWATKPYAINFDTETEPGKRLYRMKFTNDVPPHWGAAAGDVIHNLRASLDNVATALAVANGTTSKNVLRQTYFPIGVSKEAFEKKLASDLKGASDEAKRIVRLMKPYRGGTEAFRRLHDLDILDKHSHLVPVGAATQDFVWRPKMQIPGREPFEMPIGFIHESPFYRLKDGDIIFSEPSNEEQGNYTFSFYVAFGEGQIVDGEPLVETLRQLVAFVEEVVGIFDREIFQASA